MNKEKSADNGSIDKYTEVRDELTKQILKKQALSTKLSELEESIYDKEYEYLLESVYGNIVKGFENFSKTSGSNSMKKRLNFNDDDHIFSLSSMNYVKQLLRKQGINLPGNTSTIKDDFDDYEDSVDPTNSGKPVVSVEKDIVSSTSTPTRKRKIRSLDE